MAGHIFYAFMVSVDGYIAGPPSNHIGLPKPNEALHIHFNELQERTTLNLYGRGMYAVMKYWDIPPAGLSTTELEYARAWQRTPKIVFSTTLDSVGPNARLINETADTERVVRQIKTETNGEIGVNGAALAASLIRVGLVDEFRMYVMPVVLGGGKRYFESGLHLELESLGTQKLPRQCTLLRLRPKKSRT